MMSTQDQWDLFVWISSLSVIGAFFFALNDYLNDKGKK